MKIEPKGKKKEGKNKKGKIKYKKNLKKYKTKWRTKIAGGDVLPSAQEVEERRTGEGSTSMDGARAQEEEE